jgi:hypothetical protein
LYGSFSLFTAARGRGKSQQEAVNFQDGLVILLEMRLSGVAKQGHAMLYGKSHESAIYIGV